ncbi:hypothetical protein PBAL39_25135 [Pedobacter sp. BAL39]|nr:hypothetical protein [Pedobacter sp. BAL39]EDM36613.1 hypothetical protein PBAL39_25135 [Pedobacter sp. BAL39]
MNKQFTLPAGFRGNFFSGHHQQASAAFAIADHLKTSPDGHQPPPRGNYL